MPSTDPKTDPYRVRRDDHGYAAAIERDGYTVLILATGAERNEQEVDMLVSALNREAMQNVRSAATDTNLLVDIHFYG